MIILALFIIVVPTVWLQYNEVTLLLKTVYKSEICWWILSFKISRSATQFLHRQNYLSMMHISFSSISRRSHVHFSSSRSLFKYPSKDHDRKTIMNTITIFISFFFSKKLFSSRPNYFHTRKSYYLRNIFDILSFYTSFSTNGKTCAVTLFVILREG